MITVKKLKKLLEKEQDDAMVVLSSDEEGNSFSPLYEVCGLARYNKSDRSIDDANGGIGEECIVLYPE